MAYTAIAENVRWDAGESPAIYLGFYYDRYRSGSLQYYKFKVTLSPVSGASYFGYTVTEKITVDAFELVSSIIKTAAISQWTSPIEYESDWVSLTKTSGVCTAVFRTQGGARDQSDTYSLEVNPASSVIGTVTDFNLEDAFCVPVTKYDASFTDELKISAGNEDIKTIANYSSNDEIVLSDGELLGAYAALGEDVSKAFTFTTTTRQGNVLLGTDSAQAAATASGTLYINKEGIFKCALPYVKQGGAWKKAAAFINKNSEWKRGV